MVINYRKRECCATCKYWQGRKAIIKSGISGLADLDINQKAECSYINVKKTIPMAICKYYDKDYLYK